MSLPPHIVAEQAARDAAREHAETLRAYAGRRAADLAAIRADRLARDGEPEPDPLLVRRDAEASARLSETESSVGPVCDSDADRVRRVAREVRAASECRTPCGCRDCLDAAALDRAADALDEVALLRAEDGSR